MQNSLKKFFSFTKKELNGLLVFCLLLMLVLTVPMVASWFQPPEVYHHEQFKKEIAQFRASERSGAPGYSKIREVVEGEVSSPVYFRFDPNNLPEASWQKLGLSVRQIRVIKNYEAKGGKFWKKEDLKRIYSISEDDYRRLEPYIDIPGKEFDKGAFYRKNERNFSSPGHFTVMVELNSADSALLETIKGVGPVLASRIMKYRERLGGFYRKEQLAEVYGIDSVRYSSIEGQVEVNASSVVKLNVNTASFDDLKRHPYLTYKQMNAIIQYRKQHGPYTGIQDLQKIAILNDEILRKIAPYLIF